MLRRNTHTHSRATTLKPIKTTVANKYVLITNKRLGCKYKLNICTNTYIFEEILELKVFFRVIMIILGNKFFSDIPSDIFSARFEL